MMPSIYDLPSWSRDELTESQKKQFKTTEVGESLNSLRTTFEVSCDKCGEILHPQTNNPSAYIDGHHCRPKLATESEGDTNEN